MTKPPVATLLLLAAAAGPGRAESLERIHSTLERLQIARLAAAHQDVEAHRASRRQLPPLAGVEDFRAVFHAHADDSDHTGGSLDEILAAARRAEVDILFLSDHYRPPRDFMASGRGLVDSVLLIPGAEARGFLLHPSASVMGWMEEEVDDLLAAVRSGNGIAFLSHVEDRVDHPMTNLDGMEIYNRHADASDDPTTLGWIVRWALDPEELPRLQEKLRLYPDELFAAQLDYPQLYLDKWDRETQTRRLVGIGANDCHHNQVIVIQKVDDETVRVGTVVDAEEAMRRVTVRQAPRLTELTRDRAPGEMLVHLDFDPYHRSMRNTSTHVLAPRLEENAVRTAVAAGRVYVSHDWMADPTGFRFEARLPDGERLLLGDQAPYRKGIRLRAEVPLDCRRRCHLRLLRDGEEVERVAASRLESKVKKPGVYRVEAWLEVDGEQRPWIYSNPIYLQKL